MKTPLVPEIVERLVAHLRAVPGIEAVALGGSRARGTADASSDFDIGLYYEAARPIDLPALRAVVAEWDDRRRGDVLTGIDAWGPWINGGGWLRREGQAVDLLYRDLGRVEQVLADVTRGHLEVAYQPGHPHAFVSAIYLAEVAVAQPLADGGGRLADLKRRMHPYPVGLQAALVERFLWESRFSLDTARKAAARADAHYVAGCAFRSINCLLQVVFALNEAHWLNEKGALHLAQRFTQRPCDLLKRAESVYEGLRADVASLGHSLHLLDELHGEVEALAARR
ncbi:MAG: nucleotidyltransferase domain-containing protein [Rhizobacter sp.]